MFKLSPKTNLSCLLNKPRHAEVLSIAIPMILSNITVPLLGLVDSLVIGHLEHSSYLGGVALGGTMISVILWLFGSLRMAMTGMGAQAYGANDKKKQVKILLQGAILAIVFSVMILMSRGLLSYVVLSFSDASHAIKKTAEQYFIIRITSCPAAFLNLVFMGWLLAEHQAQKVMKLLIFINLINIILDFIFVPGLKMGVKGAAIGSAIADFSGSALGLYFIFGTWVSHQLPRIRMKLGEILEDILGLLKLNLDILIRSLFLQAVFIFMVFKGATFGDHIAAANAILMNFLFFSAYAMDGFAYTIEALVGGSLGAKDQKKLYSSLLITTFWSLNLSLICTFIFVLFGEGIINFMTSITEVRTAC